MHSPTFDKSQYFTYYSRPYNNFILNGTYKSFVITSQSITMTINYSGLTI